MEETKHVASRFLLPKSGARGALAAIEAFIASKKKPEQFVADPTAFREARTLSVALEAAGFSAKTNVKGDIVGLRWAARSFPSNATNFRKLLEPLGPFVPIYAFIVVHTSASGTVEILFRDEKVNRGYDGQADAELEKLYRAADKAKDRKQIDRALALYDQVVITEPDVDDGSSAQKYFSRAWHYMLEMLAENGRVAALIERGRRAPLGRTFGTFAIEGYAHWALLLDYDGNRRGAIALAKAGLKANPKDERCLELLAEWRS